MKNILILLAVSIAFWGCAELTGEEEESRNGGAVYFSTAVSTATLPVGDSNCPDGGISVSTGVDTNGNGNLDADEVDDTQYLCNGADGTDNQSVMSIHCGGGLAGEPLIGWDYNVHILNSGDVVAQGSIYTDYFEVSKTSYYSSQQVGSVNAGVVLIYDLSGSFNYGYWILELDRNTLITTVTYKDVDYTPNPATWYALASDCLVNDYTL